jgi:hypothetical protein
MGPFDILTAQHRELEEQLGALESGDGPSAPDTQRERLEVLVALLRVHARLEERHLSPLLARVEGRGRAREEAEDHLTMRELGEELEELEPGTDEWWARLTALEDLVVAHARQEEAETSRGSPRPWMRRSRRSCAAPFLPCQVACFCSKKRAGCLTRNTTFCKEIRQSLT